MENLCLKVGGELPSQARLGPRATLTNPGAAELLEPRAARESAT